MPMLIGFAFLILLTVVVLKPLFKQNFHRLNLAHEVPSEPWRDTDQRR